MVCLRNISVDTLHNGNTEDEDDDDDNDDDDDDMTVTYSGPGSVVSTATSYVLDGPGIKSWWEQDFPHLSRPALGPTQPSVQCVPSLSQGKELPGRDTDPSPLLMPLVMEE